LVFKASALTALAFCFLRRLALSPSFRLEVTPTLSVRGSEQLFIHESVSLSSGDREKATPSEVNC
jgi:hypothetical protein